MADQHKDRSPPVVRSLASETESAKDEARGSESLQQAQSEIATWRWLLSTGVMMLGAMLYGLDTTIAASVQTAVYRRFDHIEEVAWLGLGFLMASSATILFIAKLFQSFDVKPTDCFFIVIFEIGSAICGAAPSMDVLILGRVIAGIGGSGLYIGGLTFFGTLGSPSKLALYNACLGSAWSIGTVLGPVIGGALSDSRATWRWAFYINLPLSAICAPVWLLILPSFQPKPGQMLSQKLSGFDVLGSFLIAGVIAIFMTVVTFAGSVLAWKSATLIALFVVWAAFLAAFIIQQHFVIATTKATRLFPVEFLRSRTLVLLCICTACGGSVLATTLYYTPLFFGFTRGDSVLDAAKRLLPYIACVIVFSIAAGSSLPPLGRYSPQYIIGGVLIVAGSAGMVTIREHTTVSVVYGFEVLIGAGTGLVFQNAYAIASVLVKPEQVPDSVGFINLGQIGASAVTLAIANCVYQNIGVYYLGRALVAYNFPKEILQAALGGAESGVLQNIPPEAAKIAIDTIAFVLSRIFYLNIAAGAVCLLAGLAMKHEKIDLSMFNIADRPEGLLHIVGVSLVWSYSWITASWLCQRLHAPKFSEFTVTC